MPIEEDQDIVVLEIKLEYSQMLTSILRSSLILVQPERSVPGWGPTLGPGHLTIESKVPYYREKDREFQQIPNVSLPCPSLTKFLITFMVLVRHKER